jgi:hypothetical protein
MKKHLLLPALLIFILAVVFTCRQHREAGQEAPLASAARLDFNYHVKPILSDKCFACHGPDEKRRDSGLRLDTEEGAFAALKNDPHRFAIVRGNPGQSELVRRIFSEDPKLRMPPVASNLTLSEQEKEVLKKWVEQGAEYKKHWAFIPPQRPQLPAVSDESWPLGAIDRFVLAKLEEKDLRPGQPSDKERLLRRVSFDLTGLPPAVEEADAFLADNSPDAYEKAVDRLLASPAYGERWASYWLDLARYGDTHGYQDDFPRLMWPWRDWVIHAFNQNLPYDRFVTWQLAGDLLPDATKEQILASGFNRNHKITHEGGVIPEEYRTEYVMDRTGTFGKAFLGMSVECARCHDHKYDPVSQKDFYSLYAFFNNVSEVGLDYTSHKGKFVPKPTLTLSHADVQSVLTFINGKSLSPKDTLKVMVMNDDSLRKAYVLSRGQYDLPSAKQVRGDAPAAILPLDTSRHGKNRLGLARWLFDPRHPLTGRVMVNRLWQEVFGRGLVATSEDFGNQGNLPSHPELLDWLAVEFRERGWDVKHMLKLMVTSAAYRQSSVTTPALREADPENVWLARGPRYRLNSEMIRDNVLFSSGLLSREVGGPSVKPYQPEGIWEAIVVGDKGRGETSYKQDQGEKLYRRSLYTYWRKTIPPPSMLTFDAAMKETCEVRRVRTSTPLQALTLLNDPQVLEAARVLAAGLVADESLTVEQKIERAFRKILTRRPTEKEVAILGQGYREELARLRAAPDQADKLLRVGEHPQNGKADPVRSAAFMQVVSMIYNLDEAISKS